MVDRSVAMQAALDQATAELVAASREDKPRDHQMIVWREVRVILEDLINELGAG